MAVDVRAEEVFEHAEGVLDMTDIERVHDMRVATRRLRAVMEIFEPAFPKQQHRAAAEGSQGAGGRAGRAARPRRGDRLDDAASARR